MRNLLGNPVWQETIESPIEEKMLIALCDVSGWRVHRRTNCNLKYMRKFAADRLASGEILIAPQCWVGKYRMDFGVCAKSPGGYLRIIGVECDGHAYHSTPEQRARDAARDVAITEHGVLVKRFAGHEIHWNAEACAKLALGDLFDFQDWVPMNEATDLVDNGEWWEADNDEA